MPELPEVETVVRQLQRKLHHKTVTALEIHDSKVVDAKIKKIVPFRIKQVYRRAKYIVMVLEQKRFLLIHLRMTGHFHYLLKRHKFTSEAENCQRFLAAKFHLSNGDLFTYNDIRRFGHVKLLDQKQLQAVLSKLGPEPLGPNFNVKFFTALLTKKKKSNLKTMLLDQKQLAGLGNIYAQEALYRARISPLRSAGTLSLTEIKRLHQAIRTILSQAIKHHGTTVENYVHIEGSGGFQRFLAVYGQNKCPLGHTIQKISLGSRGTSYCPICQK